MPVFLHTMLCSVVRTQKFVIVVILDLNAFNLSAWILLSYLGTAYMVMVGENKTDLCSMDFL